MVVLVGCERLSPGPSIQHTVKNTLILGIALIVFGAAVLAYRQFSYQSRETVLEIGPIKATAETTKSVTLPPILGGALIRSGAVALVFAGRSRT